MLWALIGLIWGRLKVTMVTALTAITHFVGCERSQMMELDAVRIMQTSEFKPVVVVKRGHLVTPRMMLWLMAHGGPHVVLHVAVPLMTFGMVHPGYKNAYVGGFVCLMRRLAFQLDGIVEAKRNVRILSDCGVVNPEDPLLPARMQRCLETAAKFTLQCVASGLDLNKGHVPAYGDALGPLGPLPNHDIDTRALYAINTAISKAKKVGGASRQDALIRRLAQGLPAEQQ